MVVIILFFFTEEYLVMYGNFSVMGLLILKEYPNRLKSTDLQAFKFIQVKNDTDFVYLMFNMWELFKDDITQLKTLVLNLSRREKTA